MERLTTNVHPIDPVNGYLAKYSINLVVVAAMHVYASHGIEMVNKVYQLC